MEPAQQCYEVALLALVVWREARGESVEAKRAVAWSIRNRAMNPAWWGADWPAVITKRWQYTSMTGTGDPNLIAWPVANDTAWQACLAIAAEVYQGQGTDPTEGATHYYDRSLDDHPPAWATEGSMVHMVDVGALRFWKRAGAMSA